jgi:hypothetical protein
VIRITGSAFTGHFSRQFRRSAQILQTRLGVPEHRRLSGGECGSNSFKMRRNGVCFYKKKPVCVLRHLTETCTHVSVACVLVIADQRRNALGEKLSNSG